MTSASFCTHCGAENAPGAAHCHACQHPLDPSAGGDHSGALLHERYEILTEIGAGGFGAVYKARDTHQDGRLVAVKQINLQGLSAQQIIEATDAFNREADILSTLRHPMLPRIFDRFSDPHHWYLVMSLIEGQTLEDYLHHKLASATTTHSGLSLEETLSIGVQVCDALRYLHSQQPPVIFRDLKPGNLMRTAGGRLYLIDFGIARRFKLGQLKDTIPFGSPGYAAPEQYGKAQTTPQADLYSLGALLYTLISGDDPSEHPFQFPPLRVYGTDGIRELGVLIQRLVSLAPEHRPATTEEVRAELQRIQHLHALASQQGHLWIPPQGQTPPPFPAVGTRQQQIFLTPTGQQAPARKTSRRRVLTIGLIAGGVLAAFGIAGIAGNQPAQPFISKDNQSGNATALDQAPAVPLNGPTFWSPDLSHAAVINAKQNHIEIYKVLSQQTVQSMHLRDIKIAVTFSNPRIQWSADNSKIALQSDADIIYAWNVQNGQQIFTLPMYTSSSTLSWSPDGQYCAISYIDQNNNPLLTILRTTDARPYFHLNFPLIDALAWSPDSRYLAFPDSPSWEVGSLWKANIWDKETNRVSKSFSGTVSANDSTTNGIVSIAWSPKGGKLATVVGDSIWINQPDNNQPSAIPTYVNGSIYSTNLTYGPAWSPDEKYLAILTNQNLLGLYTLSSGDAAYLSSNGWQNYVYGASTPNALSNLATFAWPGDSQSIITVDNNNVISSWPLG